MVYDAIRPAAFMPDPAAGPFRADYHALAFPRAWREVIVGLYRHGRSEKIQSVPISRLNSALRAVAPDLISVARRAAADEAAPWLYTTAPYPAGVLGMFVNTWLRELQPADEAYPLVHDAIARLDVASLAWTMTTVDVAEHALTPGGTAEPASRLYRLLPEVLAARIEQLPPYEHNGEKLAFRRVAAAEGAELMSWPPLQHKTGRGETARLWHYSATIRISLHTVPFSPAPRIHLRTGIRRWVRGQLWLPRGNTATVCLLADGPWSDEIPQAARFATIRLGWDHDLRQLGWDHGGPAGILSRLTAQIFPPPDIIAKQPEVWISGSGGITAAIVHHTMMGGHGVGSGLMPSERKRLTEWAAQALAPQFRPAPDFHRSHIAPSPVRTLRRKAPVPVKDPDPAKVAAVAEKNAEVAVHNAAERRARAAAVVGEAGLRVRVLFQTDRMRDELIRAATASLDLTSAHRDLAEAPGTRIWQTRDLTVRLEASPLGALGAPLGTKEGLRRLKDRDAAITRRRTAVGDLLSTAAEPSQVVFIRTRRPGALPGHQRR